MGHPAPTNSFDALAAFVDALADGVAVIDSEGRQVWANKSFCDMLGFDRQELIGNSAPHPYWPPEHIEGISRALRETIGGATRDFELVFMKKNGERFPVTVHPARAEFRGSEVFVATVKDISALRDRDRQSEFTEHVLRTMLAGGDIASWEWHLTEGRGRVSDTYFTLLGYEPGAWGASYEEWAKRVHPDDIGAAELSMQLLLTDQSRLYDVKYRVLDVNGEWRWILARGYVTERTDDGAPARIAGTMQDIHRLRTQEQELQQFHQMELLGRLAGGLTHDLRNLIFIIGTSLDAARAAAPDDQARYLDRIDEAVELATGLTDSLLQRVGKDVASADRAVLEANLFLTETVESLGSTLPPEVQLELELDSEPCPIAVGRGALENALINLVWNARDAIAPDAGDISIGTAIENVGRDEAARRHVAPGPYVILSVTDSGAGMSQDVLERAAEPLFSTKMAGKGLGLGLSMAKKLAGESGGFARIESAADMGTTVELAFPLQVELPNSVPESGAPAGGAIRGSETVLVVDDQAEVREAVESYLRSLGYDVLGADNPRQAMALVRERSIDLLLTDVVMPFTLDGIELARDVRAVRTELPVLFMTGFLDQEQRVSTQPIGSVLRKPFSIEELGTAVRAELDRSPAGA